MSKPFIFLVIIFLSLGFFSVAIADSKNLSGYVYSESEGWISLSCANTNSCNSINYGVLADDSGKLSGYGFSQNGKWINFNPNFAGVNFNSSWEISGWAFSENGNWVRIDSEKIISAENLQNQIVSIKNTIKLDNLSDSDIINLLNNLCSSFLTSGECDIINKI